LHLIKRLFLEGKNRGKKDINTYYIVCGKGVILLYHILIV
jgi:hypothetical protein